VAAQQAKDKEENEKRKRLEADAATRLLSGDGAAEPSVDGILSPGTGSAEDARAADILGGSPAAGQ
jgi:hypothetical protein